MTDLTRPWLLLRLDGLVIAAVAVVLFRELGIAWWIFAVSFLAPDLAFVGYLAGPRVGALAYNSLHTYLGGAAAFAGGLVAESTVLMGAGLIWIAHIGVDRMVGFGLKYPDGARSTHLQRV